MKSLLSKIIRIISRICHKEIPVSMIISERTDVSTKEGWGGKHIKYFPPYSFYHTYISGNQEDAKGCMEQWYYNRFVKNNLCYVSKKHGGMLNGSLFKILKELHKSKKIILKADLSNAEDTLIVLAIKLRVEDRFKLLDSIIAHGYKDGGIYVRLKKTGNSYEIIDGHHRVAAATVCGYCRLPCVALSRNLLRLIALVSPK